MDPQDYASLNAAGLQQLLLTTETLETFLDELVKRASTETSQRCAITVRGSGGRDPYTVASSDELTRQLDEIQYADKGGPCLEALHTGVPVFVIDMATETRAVPVVQRERLTARAENLRRGMESNREIGCAIGILMIKHGITYAQGFDLLRQASQQVSRKLRELAVEVIQTGTLAIGSGGPPESPPRS